MLYCAASSCVRTGGRLLAQVARSSPPSTKAPVTHYPPRWWPPPCVLTGATRHASASSAASPPAPPPPAEDQEDHFGALSGDMRSRRSFRKSSPDIQDQRFQEEDEADEEKRKRRQPYMTTGSNTAYWYFLQCKKLLKGHKLQEALDLFSGDMLKRERLPPEEFNYTILIGGCGRAGQLKKAFKLYNDMKKRALVPTDATYTALFNACAQSPSKGAGLKSALHLEQELLRNNYPISTITYHALLKTHAITNNLQACLHTLREMLEKQHPVTQETFHYLLMGCVNEKEIGFRLALQVWRQMLNSGLRPDAMNYNLLLRTARDCGIGDPTTATYLLLSPDGDGQKSRQRSRRENKNSIDIDLLERQLLLQPGQDGTSKCTADLKANTDSAHVTGAEVVPYSSKPDVDHRVVVEEGPCDSLSCKQLTPNLLDLFERKSRAVVSIGTVGGASDRLALIGGGQGFLEKMASSDLRPDLRTLTLLADTMEPSSQSLQMLLREAKQHKVKLDLAFFNTVIHSATKAGDLEAAKAVLPLMSQRRINKDVQTYGCLALACDHKKEGLQLLKDMEDARLRPNVQVFSALIGRASRRLDYIYLKTLLEKMSELKVWPNEVIIKQLEFASQYPPGYDQFKKRNNYLVQIDGFRGYYQWWLKSMPAIPGEGTVQTEGHAGTDEQAGTDMVPQQEQPETEGLSSKHIKLKAAWRVAVQKVNVRRSTAL